MNEELTAERLFEFVLDEALRDGKIDSVEDEAVQAIRDFLGLTARQVEEVCARVRASRAKASKAAGAMDPHWLYQKCLILAAADGDISTAESARLEALQRALSITEEDHETAVAMVKAWMDQKKQWHEE